VSVGNTAFRALFLRFGFAKSCTHVFSDIEEYIYYNLYSASYAGLLLSPKNEETYLR